MSAIIPVNISFQEFANQLRNSYPTEDIPIVAFTENLWRQFPIMLLSNNCFNTRGSVIPYSEGHATWQDWASEFLQSIGS